MHYDQLGNKIALNHPPKRIVSLVPSQTELLFDLGLENEIVGITKFCIHPTHALRQKTIIGGTKKFDFDVIDQLKPDLIIGNKEENYKDGIDRLREKYSVWMSDIVTLEDSFIMINGIGEVCGKSNEASKIVSDIKVAFGEIKKQSPKKVLYLIWRKPWMVAASGTFIHSLIDRIGWVNAAQSQTRYPELSSEEIKALDPELILLSSEPYPFAEKHIDELHQIVPSARIVLVDGELFSWYGSRLMKAPKYFNGLNP